MHHILHLRQVLERTWLEMELHIQNLQAYMPVMMIYVIGSIIIDQYQEYLYSNGITRKLPDVQAISEIASLPVTDRTFEMGAISVTHRSLWAAVEPQNLVNAINPVTGKSYFARGATFHNVSINNGQSIE